MKIIGESVKSIGTSTIPLLSRVLKLLLVKLRIESDLRDKYAISSYKDEKKYAEIKRNLNHILLFRLMQQAQIFY